MIKFFAIAWGLLAAVYLLFAGSVGPSELIAAALAGAAAALWATVAHRSVSRILHLRAPWMRILRATVGALITDTIRVGWALLHARPGVMGPQRFDADGPDAAGRRAIAILALSVAPNGYVACVEQDALQLHRLVATPPAPDREWPL